MKHQNPFFVSCLCILCLLGGDLMLQAQLPPPPAAPEEGRLFLPRDTFWGFGQFDLAPPHNEIDPNLCSADAGAPQNGGVNAPCTAFARYMFWGAVEARPFGRGPLRRFMLYTSGHFLFGRNLPHDAAAGFNGLYTWSIAPIGLEKEWGGGIYLGKGFELRATQHFLFTRVGALDKNLGPAFLGNNGPWGRYNALGIRKYFGVRRW